MKRQNTITLWSSLLALGLTSTLIAQSAPASPSPEASQGQAGSRPASTEEAVVLNPFEVVGDASDTYDATNTNSITGTNLSLNKTPLNAKIFNRTIMEELDVGDVAQLLADFGGLGAPLFSSSDAQRGMQEGDTLDYKSMTSRGLVISNPRRDGFLRSDTSLMDSFDVESVEAMQGSNSLLFGSGDAGGVVNINSKRARLDRRSLSFSAKWDSEGSYRFTTDINAGTKRFAVRINGLRNEELYYRPLLGKEQEGLQVSATLKPFRWLTISGEYRHFERDHIRSGNATLRTPATLLLPDGRSMDNTSTRLITGFGGSEILDDFITLRNQDSISGALLRHYYRVESYAAAVEASAGKDLHFQFRAGKDERVNDDIQPTSQVLFHPDAPGNLYVDANGNRMNRWAMNTSPRGSPFTQAAEGYKLTGVYHRDFGRWGDHWLNAFFSDQDSITRQHQWRFFETDANGDIISQGPLASTNSGQIIMPNAWVEAFPETIFGHDWPSKTLVHPNGKTYKFAPLVYPGAVPATERNPLGLSGAVPASGRPSGFTHQDVHEQAKAFSLTSEFWGGRINTMAGFRFETADIVNTHTGATMGPINYDTSTIGVVFDTPVDGIRGYASYASNAKVTFGTTTDIFNQSLPVGQGISKEAGLKLSLWNHRVSGNISYYQTEAKNFPGSLGSRRNDVDPNGINGRNGGAGYAFSKESDGIDLRLSLRPLKPWQVTLNYSEANGSERQDVSLPILYNDEFNTTTANGQTVVGVRNAGGAIAPLMVPSNPADPGSPQTPLSIAMMRDLNSPYFAALDPESGQILNATTIGLTTPGVETGNTGLPIASHQLGFTPASPEIIVRRAGERTTGYPEHSFSIINRYQFTEGRLRGTVLGIATIYQVGIRGYMYTDAANGGQRTTFYYPDRFENRFFGTYSFKIRNVRATVQLNVYNLFDKQAVVARPSAATGAVRYFSYQYSPRKIAITTSVRF